MNLNLFNPERDKSILGNFSKDTHTFMLELQNELKNPKYNHVLKKDLYAIDRFEGDNPCYVVCQNLRTGKIFDIRKDEMPDDAIENSIVKIENNKYVRDYEEEKRKLKELQEIQKDLVRVSNIKWNPILREDVYKIEKFEGTKTEYAVCMNLRTKQSFNILKSELPQEVTINSMIKISNNEYVILK